MTYKKRSRQQYVLERKRVLSKVETKLKKASRKSETGFQTTVKPMAIAPTPEETEVSLPKGQPATLHYKGETVKVSAKIRYETMKTEPLIKTVNVADGKIVHRKFVGPEKKLVWMDDEGKEHDKKDVKLMQQHVDGSLTPIQITKTKDITVEPIDPEVMGAFQPYSFIEIWGEDDTASDSLREFAYDLVKNKKVGAVKKFSHGSGKVYVGFVHPIISNDGKFFSLELMVSENKKKYRRWMPAEPEATPKRKVKAEEPEIPEMW
ncbi:MAG: hypothetical protein QXF26_08010 [Candidatus Bathyarchaeia archaeon]